MQNPFTVSLNHQNWKGLLAIHIPLYSLRIHRLSGYSEITDIRTLLHSFQNILRYVVQPYLECWWQHATSNKGATWFRITCALWSTFFINMSRALSRHLWQRLDGSTIERRDHETRWTIVLEEVRLKGSVWFNQSPSLLGKSSSDASARHPGWWLQNHALQGRHNSEDKVRAPVEGIKIEFLRVWVTTYMIIWITTGRIDA